LTEAPRAEFPFADLKTGERWTLRPNAGRLPWWILDSRRRVPGTSAPDYLAPISVLRAPAAKTVGEVMLCSGPLHERLWRPVLLAALNTEPAEADARLAAQILRETLAAGGQACRPMVATAGLSAAFIEPAITYLARQGASVRLAHSLREVLFVGERAVRLDFGDEKVDLGEDDWVVLAVPPVVARTLIPGLTVPETFHAIANAHFRIAPPKNQPAILGVVNGMTEWLFAYHDRLSVTISAADRLMEMPRQELAAAIWREVAALTGLSPQLPRWQIVRERRATFAATPAEVARRPGAETRYGNLALAGDWTDTGLPATIEGSIRSGLTAAKIVSNAAGKPGTSRRAA
jgi:squalene-associated FAD-dependent desaturase